MSRKSSAIPIKRPGGGPPVSFQPALPIMPKTQAAPGAEVKGDRRQDQVSDQTQNEAADKSASPAGKRTDDKSHRRRKPRNRQKSAKITSAQPLAEPTSTADTQSKEEPDEKEPAGFNIYARSFVPTAVSIINTLSGQTVVTPTTKEFNYDTHINSALGPVSGFLPTPPAPQLPPGPTEEITSLVSEKYESFFQYHLVKEANAMADEMDACSLYAHDVRIRPASECPRPSQTICIVKVPGLRENSPYVEEDDEVQLRQLLYGSDGNLLGMKGWLDRRSYSVGSGSGTPVGLYQEPAPGWTGLIYFARVARVIRAAETLHLRVLGLAAPKSAYTTKFNVQFQVSVERQMPMRYALSTAQHLLAHAGWLNSMLFPTFQDCDIQEQLHPGVFRQQFYDRELNWEQKKAVESIWSRNHGTMPFLISGPPGTGKTKTIIETTLQLVGNTPGVQHHIILCAPSDPAADTLCQRLVKYLTPRQLLRLSRPSRSFAEVPDALLRFCYIENNEFSLPPYRALMAYSVVVTTCRDASILARARMTNIDLWSMRKGMEDAFANLNPFEPAPQAKTHWTALLIDEAAQATEPDALVPLAIVAPPAECQDGFQAPLVVMAGDEHQLGPRTSLPSSQLRESLFARLFKRPVYADHPLARGKKGEAPTPITQSLLPVFRPAFANLIRNYRSHPAILAVPSNLFYMDTLEPEARGTGRVSTWKHWKGRKWPVLFHDNPSTDELELPGVLQGHGGWYNRGEADIACGYAQSLVKSGLVEQQEVCIMSPFKAQVRHIRKCMRKAKYGGLWDVNIGPTEAFQGLESGVVILCTTRATEQYVERDQKVDWGIIGAPNKMNVALTRAKYGLIVVGKRKVLTQDPNWKAFLDFCDRNGLVANTEEVSDGKAGHGGSGGGHQAQLTRLERRLIDRGRAAATPAGRLFGLIHGVDPGQEMWAGGMMETPETGGDGQHDSIFEA